PRAGGAFPAGTRCLCRAAAGQGLGGTGHLRGGCCGAECHPQRLWRPGAPASGNTGQDHRGAGGMMQTAALPAADDAVGDPLAAALGCDDPVLAIITAITGPSYRPLGEIMAFC